jgi:hypothetical protein
MKTGGIYAALAAVVAAACGGTTLPATQDSVDVKAPAIPAGLPAPAVLDELHHTSDTQSIDVTAPQLGEGIQVAGANLEFASPPDGAAWAVYEVLPNSGHLVLAAGVTGGPLWLLAADYAHNLWQWTQAPTAEATLVRLDDPEGFFISGDGYVYLAVVCPPASSAVLYSLTLQDAAISPEPMLDTSLPNRILVSWLDAGIYDYFEVYRSTIPDDPAPYLIYTQDSNVVYPDVGEWFFNDPVNLDGPQWVPKERDHGTPEDPADDYPSIAPGVKYYYRVAPYYGPGEVGTIPPEAAATYPWGGRRETRRELPPTTDQILVVADQLRPGDMTSAQVQWCAENLVGTQKITKSQAGAFRQYNPDFIVLGYHLGNGAGEIGNVHGDAWDADADWPYVDRHEDWLLHRPDSAQPQQRVRQRDWNWYVADAESSWQDYLAANLLQLLGEDQYDGWFVDSCSQPWNTDPAQWWPDGESMFGFWTPRLTAMLQTVTERAKAHPLRPYIIPNAGSYITTLSDIKYYGDGWACDGIMVEGYARGTPDEYYSEADWVLEQNRILDHQAHGLATILQSYIYTPDTADRLFVFASYLLVKSDHTYINWLGDDGLDTIWPSIGQWYPEFDLDDDPFPWGAASGDPPETMTDLYFAAYDGGGGVTCGPFYRRNYGVGFVLVNPSDTAVNFRAPWHMSYLSVEGGGNVTATGDKTGSYTWEMLGLGEVVELEPHTALIIRDVFG